MSTRTPIVAGNWKMFTTAADATAHCRSLAELVADVSGVEVAVCPPYIALEAAATAAEGSGISVFAQAVHEAAEGAHTGEISAGMILSTGATGTLVGHSERRAAGETDDQVAARVRAALDAGLRVIMCCGESLEQREAGATLDWLTGQVRAGLAQVSPDEQDAIAIAYEPIWAIGTGRVASPQQAEEACAHVRSVAAERFDGDGLRVLYGGSVSPDNAAELFAQPNVDGGLVGGASLDPQKFAAIVRAGAPD